MKKLEKCVILGPSCSGKDFLVRELTKSEFKPLVKLTTRPQRKGEVEGINYYFTTEDKINELDRAGELLTRETFKVWPKNRPEEIWTYAITLNEFLSSQVMILTPSELKKIRNSDIKQDLFVVYLDIDENVRRERLSLRNDDNDSISRRIQSDYLDFEKFSDYDLKISDPDFEADWILDLMF